MAIFSMPRKLFPGFNMTLQNKWMNLIDLGLLCIAGEQAKNFLQGQLTCNLDDINSNEARLGAHCNPQGRVISLFRLFIFNSNYYLQMPRELIPIAMQALKKYAVFFKVTLTDVSDQFKQLGYVGNEITSDLIQVSGTPTRYLLLADNIKNIIKDNTDYNNWKSIDISNKIPAIYPETSEKFLPHDLNLPGLDAVSFTKGCYTGQEIIARMQYRGKLKNHLYRATVETPQVLTRGADIFSENKTAGNIVDFCCLEHNKYELLVIASDGDAETHGLAIDPERKYALDILN